MTNIRILESSDGSLSVVYTGLGGFTKTVPAGEVVALRDYFQAKQNPEPKPEPNPWHDANPGEVWLLDFGLGFDPHIVNDEARFIDADGLDYPLDSPGIKAGKRIWPADEEGDDDE